MLNRICLWLLLVTLISCSSIQKFNSVVNNIEIDDQIVRELDPRYLSFAIDTSQVVGGHWWSSEGRIEMGIGSKKTSEFDFKNPLLIELTKALSPAFLRIGGTEADKVFYDLSEEPLKKPPSPYHLSFTKKHWIRISTFVKSTDLDIMFTLNAGPGPRNSKKEWLGHNAVEFIRFVQARKDPVKVWELGNEINGYLIMHGFQNMIDGFQYAKDYKKAKEIILKFFPESIVAGPSSALWPIIGEPLPILNDFIKQANIDIDLITWHYYPQQSRRCPVATRRAKSRVLLNPIHLNSVLELYQQIKKLKIKYAPQSRIWLGETGHAQCGGEPGLSDSFESGFWWLDQLGLLALTEQEVIIRQTLIGSDYGLLDHHTYQPRPDYWSSLLWKKLMGSKVLQIKKKNYNRFIRMYAHCANQKENQVTLLVLNLLEDEQKVNLPFDSGIKYILTSDGLKSKSIYLNSKLIKLKDDEIPDLNGKRFEGVSQVLPPFSYSFFQSRSGQFKMCEIK